MKQQSDEHEHRTRTVKVSHSLSESVATRLKELAYTERVSESSIIEFVLTEFFELGDDSALGGIIRDSALTLRRNQPARVGGPVPLNQALVELEAARHNGALI